MLELTDEIPSKKELLRWCGEPIEILIVPVHLFNVSADGLTVSMSAPHQIVCQQFLKKIKVHFAIKCHLEDINLRAYANCIRTLLTQVNPNMEPIHG